MNNSKVLKPKIIALLAAIVLAVASLLIIILTQLETAEAKCINSGGVVQDANCCKSASDFPNSCLIGACGCSPKNSHSVKICGCPEGKCWNGSECILNT